MKQIFQLMLLGVMSMSAVASPVKDLKPVGTAKLEFLFWDIYESTLYSADGQYQRDQFPLALEINYLRNISAEDLLERTVKEWRKLGYTEERVQKWRSSIERLWPDINKGDQLSLRVNAQGKGQFYFNGEALGPVQSEEFSPHFLAIWLAENCSYPDLRKRLIGATR